MSRLEGTLNQRTLVTREVFSDAFIQLGGVPRMLKWAQEKDKEGNTPNMSLFYTLFAKVLPKEIKTENLNRTHEQFIEMIRHMDTQDQIAQGRPAMLMVAENKEESLNGT